MELSKVWNQAFAMLSFIIFPSFSQFESHFLLAKVRHSLWQLAQFVPCHCSTCMSHVFDAMSLCHCIQEESSTVHGVQAIMAKRRRVL